MAKNDSSVMGHFAMVIFWRFSEMQPEQHILKHPCTVVVMEAPIAVVEVEDESLEVCFIFVFSFLTQIPLLNY